MSRVRHDIGWRVFRRFYDLDIEGPAAPRHEKMEMQNMKRRQFLFLWPTRDGAIRRLFAAALFSSASSAVSAPPISGPLPVEQQASVRFVYVGFTPSETTGFVRSGELTGIPVMNRRCRNDFGEAARAATTSDLEFIDGPLPSVGDKEGIWVLPSYPLDVLPNGLGMYEVFDSAGESAGLGSATPSMAVRAAGCNRFRSAAGAGPALKPSQDGPTLEVAPAACNIPRPIACSAPKKVALPD